MHDRMSTTASEITDDVQVHRGLAGVYIDHTTICEIDNDTHKLRYRGYDIAELVQLEFRGGCAPTALWGASQCNGTCTYSRPASLYTTLPQQLRQIIELLPQSAEPMAVLRTAVSVLGCETSQTLPTEDECRQAALGLVAQFPLILGAFEAHRKSQPAPLPCRDTPHAHRVLSQLTGNPEPEAQDVVIMDKLLVIHAEHELNASCFSARVTASTLSDPYAAITSAIGTLSGA